MQTSTQFSAHLANALATTTWFSRGTRIQAEHPVSSIFMLEYKTVAWWYWLASTITLNLTVFGIYQAFPITMGIAVLQLLHFAIRDGGRPTVTVQIRTGYLIVLLLTLPEAMHWFLWVPAIGTLARVLFSYCIMARMLVLLPVNRKESLSMDFVKKAFLTPPRKATPIHSIPLAC